MVRPICFHYRDGLRDDIGHADLAIVPGTTIKPDGEPSPQLKARLDRAAELYRQGYFPQVMMSGDLEANGYDEATVMRDYLARRCVPAANIVMDRAGNNTYLTARHATAYMKSSKLKSAFVVTQCFHIARCRLALRQQGIETVYSAHARRGVRWIFNRARDIWVGVLFGSRA